MRLMENKIFDSRIKSDEVSTAEILLGYLVGPALCYLTTTSISGNYLVQFYTDVLGISGSMVVMMPLVSKAFAAVSNVLIGRLIEKGSSVQGKARPWILLSGPLLAISGALLYAVPRSSYEIQILWMIFSYNLFFVGANNFYALAHVLMLPRSTSNTASRDRLSLMKNISEAMIPGTLTAVIMPFLVRNFGVGPLAQSNWFRFMLMLSLLAVPGSLLEYYFTRERVSDNKGTVNGRSFHEQFTDCVRDPAWLIIIILFSIKAVEGALSSGAMIYYSNWVLSSSVQEGVTKQLLLNVIGQFPMGIGIFMIYPLVRKFGKIDLMKIGYLIGLAGSILMFAFRENLIIVLIGLFIRSIGALPAYLSMSLLSDIVDEIEKKKGYRPDTLSVTISSIITIVATGLAQSVLLLGIRVFGYVTPSSVTEVIVQNDQIRFFFSMLVSGIHILGLGISYLLISRLKKE